MIDTSDPHRVAARLLDGHPFGFTRRHLAALRYRFHDQFLSQPVPLAELIALDVLGSTADEEAEDARDMWIEDRASEAVCRIAALLPPDDPAEPPDSCTYVFELPNPYAVPAALSRKEWARILPGMGLDGVDLVHLAEMGPHALAARALYGQPFGFTRQQLAAVRFLVWYGGAEMEDFYQLGCDTHTEALERIPALIGEAIERVAALLGEE